MKNDVNRNNNFDFLRLLFASFVIITHSYPLSGIKECDWLCQLTNGQTSLSYIGVRGFFAISGFLIYQSVVRSTGVIQYYWKRFLRLFPGLFVVLFLTVLLAPFIYENKNIAYLENKEVWTYIPNNMSLYNLQYSIQGVFEKNYYKNAINGSLWTIPYEFTLYILLSVFIFFKGKVIYKRIALLSLMIFFLLGNILFYEQLGNYFFYLNSGMFLNLGAYFIIGALLAAFNIQNFKFLNQVLYFSLVGLLFSLIFHQFYIFKFILLPITIILFGMRSTPFINKTGKCIGDVSYGMYIYGFPVQQTLQHFFELDYLELMCISLLISFALGFISWHLIEKNALKLKKMKFNLSLFVN